MPHRSLGKTFEDAADFSMTWLTAEDHTDDINNSRLRLRNISIPVFTLYAV